jgi:hypothetical protein
MLAVVLSMSRRVPDSGSEDDGELHSALQRMHRTVPDLCSSAHRQIRIFSARVPDLFGTLHGLRRRMREASRRDNEEVCSNMPAMRSRLC